MTYPVDPTSVMERTGYACIDESGYPKNSVFELNVRYFYDMTCIQTSTAADKNATCHVTQFPQYSCVNQLKRTVGRSVSIMTWKRVAWSSTTAAAFRIAGQTPAAVAAKAPDFTPDLARMKSQNAFMYKFFDGSACELSENMVGALGWRKLLAFSAAIVNIGGGAVQLGNPYNASNPFVINRQYEWSSCHNHWHFNHYGDFGYNTAPGAKRAFCMQNTNRFLNDETTLMNYVFAPPLTSDPLAVGPYGTILPGLGATCVNQGISAGWGDEYQWGIPGQWVDVTGVDSSSPHDLTFKFNPDEMLCEGTLLYNPDGSQVQIATPFVTTLPPVGLPVSKQGCALFSNKALSNSLATVAGVGGDSFVVSACTRGESGPLRSCGFKAFRLSAAAGAAPACAAGAAQTLTCATTAGAAAVVRVCEKSAQLGSMACAYGAAAANVLVVGTAATPVAFACPAVRDAAFVGGVPKTVAGVGGFSLFTASAGTLAASDGTPPTVTCSWSIGAP